MLDKEPTRRECRRIDELIKKKKTTKGKKEEEKKEIGGREMQQSDP